MSSINPPSEQPGARDDVGGSTATPPPPAPPSEEPGARDDVGASELDLVEASAPAEWNRLVHAFGVSLPKSLERARDARRVIGRIR